MNFIYYDIIIKKRYGAKMIASTPSDHRRLPEFQKFLLDKKLVAGNKTSYFAYWVSRFLVFAEKQQIAADAYHETTVAAFIDELRVNPGLVHILGFLPAFLSSNLRSSVFSSCSLNWLLP